jgi:putative sterol carrier protein
MADIQPYLQRIVSRFDDPAIGDSFKGFNKVLQFLFTDTSQEFMITVANDGTAALTEGKADKADITITTTTDVMAGILDKKVNPMTAFATRKIKVAGAMDDMMKLQKLML